MPNFILYAKPSAGNIGTSWLKYAHTHSFGYVGLAYYTLEATCICIPKMMLPAPQTSCLKYSHTNLQSYIGISTLYIGDSLSMYVKK